MGVVGVITCSCKEALMARAVSASSLKENDIRSYLSLTDNLRVGTTPSSIEYYYAALP